jgi:hypothetical protein
MFCSRLVHAVASALWPDRGPPPQRGGKWLAPQVIRLLERHELPLRLDPRRGSNSRRGGEAKAPSPDTLCRNLDYRLRLCVDMHKSYHFAQLIRRLGRRRAIGWGGGFWLSIRWKAPD